MTKKIIIFSGGTGGHVIPSINFGNYLIENGYDCHLILDKRGIVFSKFFKGRVYVINASHFSGSFLFKIKSTINLLLGLFQSLFIIFKIKPTICISFGSYATLMPLSVIVFFKCFRKIKLYLHEQNSVIGKVNLIFLTHSIKCFTAFKEIKNINYNYNKKIYYVGLPNNNPIIDKKINRDKKVILVYGGSQGSFKILDNLSILIKKFEPGFFKDMEFIIQCPKELISKINNLFKQLNINYKIKDFYSNINEILSVTDVAITRAGAGTIHDLIKYSIPSIIIPLPNSINNHQYHNAKYLSEKKAAILINEKDFNNDANFELIHNLISNINFQQEVKNNLKKIILPDTNNLMLKHIINEN